MQNIYLRLLDIDPAKKPVLATVTGSSGSTPQKPGSTALFTGDGLLDGTVGGGVTEGRVGEAAINCSKSGTSVYMTFDLYSDISEKSEAICGGVLSVLIDGRPLNHLPVFRAMKEDILNRRPGVLVSMKTPYKGSQVLINRYWFTKNSIPEIDNSFLEQLLPAVNEIIDSGDHGNFRTLKLSLPDQEPVAEFFMEPVFPLPRLIIAGAGHIGRALSHLGSLLGFEVTVIDSRSEFANRNNLPDADIIITGNIGDSLKEQSKDKDTYIVIVTRGHSDDAEALSACIGSRAGYVGMIGSRPKIAQMKKKFLEEGLATEDEWAAIHTPIGLEIGSKTVNEIAVSIAAQLVKVRSESARL